MTLPRIAVSSGLEAPRPGRQARVWLRVADNGPGVPGAAREQIFQPFFTTKSEGLGIALLERIDNDDPTALIGLPLIRTARMIRAAGVQLL